MKMNVAAFTHFWRREEEGGERRRTKKGEEAGEGRRIIYSKKTYTVLKMLDCLLLIF